MSYALVVGGSARRAIRQLPIQAQEDIWDLFEAIAGDPRSPGELSGQTTNAHSYRSMTNRGELRVAFAVSIDDVKRIVFIPLLQYSID